MWYLHFFSNFQKLYVKIWPPQTHFSKKIPLMKIVLKLDFPIKKWCPKRFHDGRWVWYALMCNVRLKIHEKMFQPELIFFLRMFWNECKKMHENGGNINVCSKILCYSQIIYFWTNFSSLRFWWIFLCISKFRLFPVSDMQTNPKLLNPKMWPKKSCTRFCWLKA